MQTPEEANDALREATRDARRRASQALGAHEAFVRLVMRYASTVGALLGVSLVVLPMDRDAPDGWLLNAPFGYLGDGGPETIAGLAFLTMVVSLAISVVTTLWHGWSRDGHRVGLIARTAPVVFTVCASGLSLLLLSMFIGGEREFEWVVPMSLSAATLMLLTMSCARHLEPSS